jgi:probable HAF family extracellular repeat protein
VSWRPPSILAAILSVSSMLLGSPRAMAQAADNLIDLGAVGPGLGINNSGEVVLENYIYSNGMLTAFPTGFTGNAINASGTVAGSISSGASAGIYADGTVTALPTPNSQLLNENNWAGVSINDSGEVLVDFDILDTDPVPTSDLYSNGTLAGIPGMTFYGPPDNNECVGAVAQANNDSGQITGNAPNCETFDGFGTVFLYSIATAAMTNLDIVGSASAINANAEVTGLTIKPPSTTSAAFLYSNGKVTLLPGGARVGYAINASGFVVGDGVNGLAHAFLYNGTTIDLNTLVQSTDPLKPYVTLTDARGINDNGLIVVNGVDSRDKSNHVYLLQMSSASSSGNSSSGSGKGGGALDSLSLSFLIGMLALCRVRRNIQRPQ